jgi:thiamine-monophosphate kinase
MKPPRGSERAFTAGLARFFGGAPGLATGIGDDAAVVGNRGRHSVVCCDPVVEGVHFTAADPLALVGQKAVNRNLSDLAAMGAKADWLLVSLLLPRGLPAAQRRQLLVGVRRAARRGGCTVVGGDVASTPGPLVVTVTAIGHLPGRALLRSGARVGDTLHTTGLLGGAMAGHHLRFRPALQEGQWLATQPAVTAAIDLSDGLLLDLATLLQASGVAGAELDAAALPIRPCARQRCRAAGQAVLPTALGEGEDYCLLWTQRAGRALAAGGPLTNRARRPIGRLRDRPGLWLVHAGGQRERLAVQGYDHGA